MLKLGTDTLELEIAIDVIRTVVKVTIDSALDLNGSMARCLFDVIPDSGTIVTIKSRSAAMSVIAHEAVHAAAFMLEHRGISTQHDQMELTAYVVQHICEKVENALYS